MEIYTIGFTRKDAAQFFESLKKARIERLIDVRLNNSSQLSAFSKKNDLRYFLSEICGAEYLPNCGWCTYSCQKSRSGHLKCFSFL
jgi:uncharacterized protein (DUF488 family)